MININSFVKLVCSGDTLFQVKYIGKNKCVVESESGEEKFVSIKNIRQK